jgi:outer membrane cobalamin receptor
MFQPQAINEIQVEDGVTQFFAPQSADQLVAGLEHTFGESLELRIEAYRKDYSGLRPRYENLFDPFSILPELQADRIEVAPDDAFTRGIEAMLRQRGAGPVDWWLSYAWAEAKDEIDGQQVSRSWEQRHAVNGGVSWQRGPWNVTLAGSWRSGWPTTGAYLADGTGPEVVVGPRNAINFSDFVSIDLRASYTTDLGPGQLETFVEFTNLTVHDNPCCSTYTVGVDAGGANVLNRDLDYWPRFVPNLGIRWRY